MDPDLVAIQTAVETGDLDTARTLSDTYVTANPSYFTDQANMTIDECVAGVDAFRAAAMDTNQWQMEAWLLHHFEPQDIGGTYQPVIRIPGTD